MQWHAQKYCNTQGRYRCSRATRERGELEKEMALCDKTEKKGFQGICLSGSLCSASRLDEVLVVSNSTANTISWL